MSTLGRAPIIAFLLWSTATADKRYKAPPAMDSSAARALKLTNNDINRAQSLLFEEKLQVLRESDPELFASVVEQRKQNANSNVWMDGKLHSRLVEISWDVVGSFMSPITPIDESVFKKCYEVAEACVAPGMQGSCAVLDVGCGDAAMLSPLRELGADESKYVGIDLSSKMISNAKARLKYEKSKEKRNSTGKKEKLPTFVQGNFLTNSRCLPPAKYHTVLFNGSFQFFSSNQWTEILTQARSLLNVGGRVVISHVNGAEFVKLEKAGNSATCLSVMPSVDELNIICNTLKCIRILKSYPDLENFYLAVLEAV